ncbi:MAG: SpoIID/LytB domain-containing protein [Spirochaetes bacterium]|nr:SpoIID/LytB domain-containing protein [Spirochaetota bacterium]
MTKWLINGLIWALLLLLIGCVSRTYRVPDRPEKAEPEPVTILVVIGKSIEEINLQSDNAVLLNAGKSTKLPTRSVIEVNDGYIIVNGKHYTTPVYFQSPNKMRINGKEYFGSILIQDRFIINILPVEEYLKGVLSSEVAENWPVEALKAQAVVSRTFAYRKILNNKDTLYDVDDTTMYQKFDYSEINSRINSAILDTNGIIILYQNEPIEAFFHSNSGGVTENCRDIFQKDLPYLRSIPDPYSSKNQDTFWTFSMTGKEIKAALKGIIMQEYESLVLRDIRIYKKTGSRRAGEFLLIFEKNQRQVIKGNTFRLAVDPKSLKSLLIHNIHRERRKGGYIFTFSGRGYGHGVGLSQLGAKRMAEQGFSYRDIIVYYYRGTRLGNY